MCEGVSMCLGVGDVVFSVRVSPWVVQYRMSWCEHVMQCECVVQCEGVS